MKQKQVTTRFLRALGAFLVKHPEDEKRIEEIMNQIVVGKYAGLHIHPLHGPLRGLSAASISKQHRLVFVQESHATIFIDIGSHDEVY